MSIESWIVVAVLVASALGLARVLWTNWGKHTPAPTNGPVMPTLNGDASNQNQNPIV
ncbi:hypothetical protein RBB84_18725 [Rhodococcus sp. D-6]|uniref:Uncharacterized protein n=2 Tax=Rhodococcus TaxID=1827 RepID=A0A7M2XVV1_9NOCA|nr:hypothetical protein [Rhodococcus pyridinivorans]QOW01889.1 hypothetical protein INP59_27425 [Rhodococcus pyridinivorans]